MILVLRNFFIFLAILLTPHFAGAEPFRFPKNLDEAIEILATSSIKHAAESNFLKAEYRPDKIFAVDILLQNWSDPRVLPLIVNLIHPEQSPTVIDDILNPERYQKLKAIPENSNLIHKLLALLEFKNFKPAEKSDEIFFKNKNKESDVRTFAAFCLGEVEFQTPALKSQVIKALKDYIAYYVDDYGPSTALRSLKKLGFEYFHPIILSLLSSASSAPARVAALEVLTENRPGQTRSDRILIASVFTDHIPIPRPFKNERKMEMARDRLDVNEAAALALGLDEHSIKSPSGDLTDFGFISVIEKILERKLEPAERKFLLQLRPISDFAFSNNAELITASDAKEFDQWMKNKFPLFEHAGILDFNSVTGIAEKRTLLETGLFGVTIPQRWAPNAESKCINPLRDLGVSHIWENL